MAAIGREWVYTFDDSGNMIHADYYDDSEGTWQYAMQYFYALQHRQPDNMGQRDTVCGYVAATGV